MGRRNIALCLIVIATILVCYVNATYPTITPNNRFVIYVVIFCIDIAVLLWLYLKHQKTLRNLLVGIVAMTAFAFLLVPLYNVFCQVTGLNGKVDLTIATAPDCDIDYSREITVEFVVSQNLNMPWDFKPKHHSLKLHPGQLATTAYFAKNTTTQTMFAQAIPSISPAHIRQYFKKTECFCFTKQKLGPGESAHLGLRFYLDPKLPKDVQRITLAYTIFDITNMER